MCMNIHVCVTHLRCSRVDAVLPEAAVPEIVAKCVCQGHLFVFFLPVVPLPPKLRLRLEVALCCLFRLLTLPTQLGSLRPHTLLA